VSRPSGEYDEYKGDWEDERDLPLEQDMDDEDADETPTVACPNCGREVADFADRCPHCGDWIVQGGATGAGRPNVWLIVIAAALIVAFVFWQVL
jgi:hypothetical protein